MFYTPGTYGGGTPGFGGYSPSPYSPGAYRPGGFSPWGYNTQAQQLDPARRAERMGDINTQVDRSMLGGQMGGWDNSFENPQFAASEGTGLGFLVPLALGAISGGGLTAPGMVMGALGQAAGTGLDQFGRWGISQAPEGAQPWLYGAKDVVGAAQGLSGQGSTLDKAMGLLGPLQNAWNAIRGNNQAPPPPSSMDLLRAWTAQGDQQRSLQDQASRYNSLMQDSNYAQQMRDIMYQGNRGWGAAGNPWNSGGTYGKNWGAAGAGGGRNWAAGGAPLM